jgi:hypothetical protein
LKSFAGLHPDIERLALLGWRLVPVTRQRAGFWKGYIDSATSDLEALSRWQREHPNCNWVVIPEGSGVWALDIDVPPHHADGQKALQELCEQHGPIPQRPHGRSGSGGHLMIFRDTGVPIRCGSGAIAPGIDARARRNSFTVAPSRNKAGLPYRWQIAPWEVEPPVAPAWLLRLLQPPPPREWAGGAPIITEGRARRALERAINSVMRACPGQRNSALNAASFTAGGLIAGGLLDQQEATNALYAAGRSIGLGHAECRATIRSGLDGGAKQPLKGRRDV